MSKKPASRYFSSSFFKRSRIKSCSTWNFWLAISLFVELFVFSWLKWWEQLQLCSPAFRLSMTISPRTTSSFPVNSFAQLKSKWTTTCLLPRGLKFELADKCFSGRILLIFMFMTLLHFTFSLKDLLVNCVGMGLMLLVAVGYKTKLASMVMVCWLIALNCILNDFWRHRSTSIMWDFKKYDFFQVTALSIS